MPPAVPRRPQAAESKPRAPGNALPSSTVARRDRRSAGRDGGGTGPGQRGPQRGPRKGGRAHPCRRGAGGPRPANYSPPSGDGPGQAKGCPPHPGRQKRPQRPHSRHGGNGQTAWRAARRAPRPGPQDCLEPGRGAAPPALRAAAKTDRGRPATAHGGPGPTPPGPDDHQPPGARARRGAARASRAIFMPPHSFWSRGRPKGRRKGHAEGR
jgi:hypothetical protein